MSKCLLCREPFNECICNYGPTKDYYGEYQEWRSLTDGMVGILKCIRSNYADGSVLGIMIDEKVKEFNKMKGE